MKTGGIPSIKQLKAFKIMTATKDCPSVGHRDHSSQSVRSFECLLAQNNTFANLCPLYTTSDTDSLSLVVNGTPRKLPLLTPDSQASSIPKDDFQYLKINVLPLFSNRLKRLSTRISSSGI
jgi:hypothetical protein